MSRYVLGDPRPVTRDMPPQRIKEAVLPHLWVFAILRNTKLVSDAGLDDENARDIISDEEISDFTIACEPVS